MISRGSLWGYPHKKHLFRVARTFRPFEHASQIWPRKLDYNAGGKAKTLRAMRQEGDRVREARSSRPGGTPANGVGSSSVTYKNQHVNLFLGRVFPL